MCLILSVVIVIIYYYSTILGIKNFCNIILRFRRSFWRRLRQQLKQPWRKWMLIRKLFLKLVFENLLFQTYIWGKKKNELLKISWFLWLAGIYYWNFLQFKPYMPNCQSDMQAIGCYDERSFCDIMSQSRFILLSGWTLGFYLYFWDQLFSGFFLFFLFFIPHQVFGQYSLRVFPALWHEFLKYPTLICGRRLDFRQSIKMEIPR